LSLRGGFEQAANAALGKKSKKQPENSEMDNSLRGCGFVQNIAPISLSRDRRIKMEQNKTNKQITAFSCPFLSKGTVTRYALDSKPLHCLFVILMS